MIFNDGDGNLEILSGQVGLEALCCDFSFGQEKTRPEVGKGLVRLALRLTRDAAARKVI